jgi:hypothetical protein
MSIYKILRSKLYRNSDLLQYLWLRHTWKKYRVDAEHVSDEVAAIELYKLSRGKALNLDDPQTFDEKLWYLKLHNHDPLLTVCSDKYRVREYVEQCGLGHILNELYGVYDDARNIDFRALPSPCFLKCNHTSGYNFIYDRNKTFGRQSFIREFNFMLKQNYYWNSREWNYKNIEPRIVAERVLRDKEGNLPLDYKFLCFGGEPKLLFLDINVCSEDGSHNRITYRNIYDMTFSPVAMRETREHKNIDSIQKPQRFDDMVKYAAILSEPFPHCRIDLFNVDGKIYFGEITFYHGGCCNDIQPPEWDLQIGSWIDISKIKAENYF